MSKVITAPPKYKILVANIEGAGDPSRNSGGNPVKIRTGFETQVLPEIPLGTTFTRTMDPLSPGIHTHQGLLTDTVAGVPVRTTCSITVSDNDFTYDAILTLGDFTVTSNDDFTPGGDTTLTAVALAAAITNLPGFDASSALNVVSVTGPFGLVGSNLQFKAVYRGATQNYTLSPTTGFLSGGEPTIGPPTIL